jgi:hypothetical protein
MKTKRAAIQYAVAALEGADPKDVIDWLNGYGVKVSRSKVSPEVTAYRDTHWWPANDGDTQSEPTTTSEDTQPGMPAVPEEIPSPDRDNIPAADETVPTVSAGNGDTLRTVPTEHQGHQQAEDTDSHAVPIDDRAVTTAAEPAAETATAPQREERAPMVAFACYAAAVMSLAVSLNTSWRFFDLVLHIPTAYGERYMMFAVAELALVVCGAGMAVNVHRHSRPGSFRMIVWAMCAAMAYMAWAESTPEEALGRILLGPVLGTIMLHLGLGLELRARHQHTGALARIGRELRERCLSRLGLADDERDAAQRTRDRAACKAAALSQPRRALWSRQARLERALLAAGVADDWLMRDRMLARLAVVQHAQELPTLTQPSPWNYAPAA